jgi:hypothetical protein
MQHRVPPRMVAVVAEGDGRPLALLAAGVSRVVAIFGMQGWRWDWFRKVRELVFALETDPAGQQQWRQLARQATLWGKRVAVLPAAPAKYEAEYTTSETHRWVARDVP